MATKAFFRATEVWTPSADRTRLELVAGLYDDLPYFEAISRGMTLGHNEGLPGKAWSSGHPIMLKDLTNSYFRRGEAAMSHGLSCALALPIFGQTDLTAVIVLFFGDNRYQRGAVELWNAPAGSTDMAIVEGYFGRAEQLSNASRDSRFARGRGVPGTAWDSQMPVVVANVASDDAFVRRDSAQQLLIQRAVGIPCSASDGGSWVLTFLSVRNSPLARRFECWVPDESSRQFKFANGYCEIVGALQDVHATTQVSLDTGPFAEMGRTGIPIIDKDIAGLDGPVAQSAREAGLESMVAMPIFVKGRFKAVVAWYL